MNKKKEIYSGAFFIVVGLLYFIGTLFIRKYNALGNIGINSVSIPRALAIIMLILGSVQFINGYKMYKIDSKGKTKPDNEKKKRKIDKHSNTEDEVNGEEYEDKKSIVLTFLLLIILALFIESVGFIIMSTLFLIAQMTLLTHKENRKRKLPSIVIMSIVFSVSVYLIFTKGFSLILPSGILG